MGTIRQAVFTLVRRLYGWLLPVGGALGSDLIQAADDTIRDGVDYSRPMVLPGWMRREMAKSEPLNRAVAEALRESAANEYASQFGKPYSENAPIAPVTEDPLMEWDWATRERVLSNCHAAYTRNPLANSIVQFTTQFVVGDGFNLSVRNKDVEAVLQAFIDHPDNAIRTYERQAVNDLQVDGELILRLFGGEGDTSGEIVAVPQRPWELQYIRTQPGFFRRVEQYHFQYRLTAGDAPDGAQEFKQEPVAADEIIFVALNRHSYELRGRPELYRLLPWLRADTEWHSDRARQSKWRNALLWVVKVANATSAQVAAVSAKWRKPPPPGSVYVSSDKETVEAASNSSGASDAMHDGRYIRLMSVMGARLPEYFFGDGKQSNLATATKQELPALTKFETFQQVLIAELWTPLFKAVIRAALDAGVEGLTEMVEVQDADGEAIPDEEPIAAVDAFTVTYEPVTQQDIWQLTQAMEKQKANGFIDDTTAMERLGNDPHLVRKRQLQDMNRDRDLEAQGLKPRAPGMDAFDDVDGEGTDESEDDPTAQNGQRKREVA